MTGLTRKILVFAIFIYASIDAMAQSMEYFVKASMIEKFARFTEWNNQQSDDSFVICVVGKSPFNGELEKMAEKVKIKNLPVKIIYTRDYKKIQACQVIFICSSEKNHLSDIIENCFLWHILSVGDSPGFSEKGVDFNFYYQTNQTIHFEINPKAIEKSGLKVDMLLLNLGKITN